ncbi:MAG: 50S ribosomal protein L6 [Devosia sp.]|uniref:50S ribosomal protein L6 n=1 Tax=Devosia sp. TaxID=1871048 RepID=UPI001AD3EC46|nr:50S ribosomal protein L6 [Devosia sp.]MBN9308262.1 50S ribosomal protein L6 [Devosia sp.]MBN9314536.1 50S ribosomal protein L6 [Devosia sp.]
MSRTGKKPIPAVSGVTVTIADRTVTAKGPKGEQSLTLMDIVSAKQTDEGIVIEPANDSKEARAAWGTTRALINNMVIGVKDGFERKLQIQGVGYRAAMQGKDLKLSLGFSHEVVFETPKGITIAAPTQTEVVVTGVDKQQVGQVAADIRGWRPPEPYKGKGVRYVGEYIARKEGKKK